MTLPTAATTTVTQPFSVIARKHRDGSVLLSTARDRVFKLNGVGALTWLVLEQSSLALSLEDVIAELCMQFETINAGGEMHYDVPREQLQVDTARFITGLVENGLLRVVQDTSGQECYRINEDVSGTISATVSELGKLKAETGNEFSVAQITPALAEQAIQPTRRETLTALFGLFAFDLLLRFRGFEALINKVERWPTTQPHNLNSETCGRVCAMVNRAQVYYPKKAMCLQHSAVVTCLLRRKGVPAEMVLAAQEFPPKGHAWVEVQGRVVNDKASVREIYRTLRRV